MTEAKLLEIMMQSWRAASASGVRATHGAGSDRHGFMAKVLEADALNNAHGNLPGWLRRILRKQGRINRMLHLAASDVEQALAKGGKNPELTDQCARHLDAARDATHAGKGPGFIKRLSRDQEAFNREFARMLELMERVIDERWAGGPKPAVWKDVSWHLREAIHLNQIHGGEPRIWRRLRRNQYKINLCLIVAIKHMPELFVH